MLQLLLPAVSRVVSCVVTGWPAALVVLPSHRTTTSPAPSIAVLPAKPQGSAIAPLHVPLADRIAAMPVAPWGV